MRPTTWRGSVTSRASSKRLARYEIHRPAVTATANEWDRHVREVKARITEAKHRR